MKIVSWNCRGAFRKKYEKVTKYNADIYVIPEAENPKKYEDNEKYKDYNKFASNYPWIGNYDDKGLGIFAKEDIKIEDNSWNTRNELFLSVRVNDSFDLVGVWTLKNYVEQAIPYLRIQEDKIKKSDKIVFCGDFNSNKVFNNHHKGKDHCDMVKIFNSYGLKSIYHYNTKEKHGSESVPTFFEYSHEDKAFHIDYVFSKPGHISNLEIGSFDEYVACEDQKSDHVPLIFEFNE